MKTSTFLSLFLLYLILVACGTKRTITTRINTDGSCNRTLTARGDSADFREQLFLIAIDSSWSKELHYEWDTIEKKTLFVYSASKDFSSIKEMNLEFLSSSKKQPVNLQAALLKKFRWFYTLFEYQETYQQTFPFKSYPLSYYLTRQEIGILLYGEDDSSYFAGADSLSKLKMEDELEQKALRFANDNIFDEFILSVEKSLAGSSFQLPQISDSLQRESMKKLLSKDFGFPIFEKNSKDTTLRPVMLRLDSAYRTDAFSTLYYQKPSEFSEFEAKYRFATAIDFTEEYTHRFILPGTIVSTNALSMQDGIPIWKIGPVYYMYTDYTMQVSSRNKNPWAFWLLGVLLILALGSLLLKKRE